MPSGKREEARRSLDGTKSRPDLLRPETAKHRGTGMPGDATGKQG
ncbi:hypothetical protein DFO46_4540 [Rhizobium sp. AG855]|nr:hypothetical protein DFO46_4540 [Rhizobium sp. AG855]